MFASQSQQAGALALPGLDAQPLDLALPTAKFDLTLSLAPQPDGGVTGGLEYDADLFDDATVRRWAGYFVTLAKAMAPLDQPLALLPLMDATEEAQVLRAFNDTDHPVQQATLPELFAAQVLRTPDATALVFGDEVLSYAQLDARANQLARHLIGLGAGPERIVALALPRSFDMVVSILAVLKSGAAYLPVDPGAPPARIAYMLHDSKASLLVTTAAVLEAVGAEAEVLPPALLVDDADWEPTLAARSPMPVDVSERRAPLTAENLAYLIYTSGSTGMPKAVAVSHAGLTNYLDWAFATYAPAAGPGAPFNLSIAFDASIHLPPRRARR